MISCIVTTYKRPVSVLKRAVDSVMKQTYSNIEVIVVNDAPEDEKLSDEIREMLNGYDKEIQYLVSEKSMGPCGARNLGLKQAKGEYVAFLDDDDEWLPQKLEVQFKRIKEKNVALVYCSHYSISDKGKIRLIEEPLAMEGIHNNAFESLLRCNFIGSTSYPLLRTKILEEVGGFNEDIESSQDHELWLRIAQEHAVFYVKEPLVRLYSGGDSISRNKSKVLQGYEYLLREYGEFYKQNKELWNYRLNYLAVACIILGFYDKSFGYWIRAFRVKPFSRHNAMLLGKFLRKLQNQFSGGE